MKYWACLTFLVALGSMKMLGDLTGVETLSGLGAATNASPAMKVFTAHRGYETFSSQFSLRVVAADGGVQDVTLSPGLYRRLDGPYNRRNVYGAALSYGPVLLSDTRTRALFRDVAKYGLCRPDGLLAELQLRGESPTGSVLLRYAPRQRDADPKFANEIEVRCE